MTEPDTQLLRRFATEGDEGAFATLVERHLRLVYSAALRQVDGDASVAEDVTQTVFADLACKASLLLRHTSLSGWLYTSTRYAAANQRRTEARRRAREQEALRMNPDPTPARDVVDWAQLRPLLDDAMHELSARDREAILLRYFERCSLTELGHRTGLRENAARMRVDRAIDRLHHVLEKRGIKSTATALGLALGSAASADVPAGLGTKITQAALARVAVGAGASAALIFLMTQTKTKLLLGLVALALLLIPVTSTWNTQRAKTSTANRTFDTKATSSVTPANDPVPAETQILNETPHSPVANEPLTPETPQLALKIVAADSGTPIPGVRVERGWVKDAEFLTQRDGIAIISYSTNTRELRLTTRLDGYADTRVKWNRERGETVPNAYTLRLEKAVRLSGIVVNPAGDPVPSAKVSLGTDMDSLLAQQTVSHEFGYAELETDENGRWSFHRIAEDALPFTRIAASHPEYVRADTGELGKEPVVLAQLRAGTHRFQLGKAAVITGFVVDPDGVPIADATVRAGHVGEVNTRETKSLADGTFTLRGCLPGSRLLSAEAKGYAATTEEVQIEYNSTPFRLVLNPGTILRLRVVDAQGTAVPKAHIWLNTFERGPVEFSKPQAPPVQAEVQLRTDVEGRALWENAPDQEMTFDIEGKGHMRVSGFKVRPDGNEHTVILPPALIIEGTVRDASTKSAITNFTIVCGWPQGSSPLQSPTTQWSRLDRHSLKFGGGVFRHSFQEALILGTPNPGYILKFEASGYTPQQTRTLLPDEGTVRLDIQLEPGVEKTLTIATPDGQRAAFAEIALVGMGGHMSMTQQGFESNNGQNATRIRATKDGTFQLPVDPGLWKLIAVHASGCALASPSQFVDGQTTWVLQPWGSIEGLWYSGGKPAVEREVLVQAVEQEGNALRFEFSDYKATTDAQGRFQIPRLPPGRILLTQLIRSQQMAGTMSWGHGKSTEVEIEPAKPTLVTLGTNGYQVIARVALPKGPMSGQSRQFYGSISAAVPQPPAELNGNPKALQQWWQQPAIRDAQRKARLQLQPFPDGSLIADEVLPGEYTLFVGATVQDATGAILSRMGSRPITVSIPVDPGFGTLDLGEVPVHYEPEQK